MLPATARTAEHVEVDAPGRRAAARMTAAASSQPLLLAVLVAERAPITCVAGGSKVFEVA